VVTDPQHDQMIDLLIRSRLVMSDSSVVEIAHEALAAAWPRLRGWLDDDVDGQRVLHHLATAADAWDTLGRPDSELYRGVRLAAAREWRTRALVTLSSSEQAFLDASDRLASTELRAAQESSRRQRRSNRRLRGLLGVAAGLLVAALVAGLLALDQTDRARTSREAALRAATAEEARRVGARALVSSDLARSMLLAVEGVRLEDSPETQANLLAVLAKRPQLISSAQGAGDDYLGLGVSPDGRRAVVLDANYDVRTFDLDSGAPGPIFEAHPSDAAFIQDGQVEFHPSGRFVAVTAAPFEESPVRLLDARTMRPLAGQLPTLLPATTRTLDLSLSTDGRFLAASVYVLAGGPAWVPASTRALVWDVSVPTRPQLVLSRRLSLPGESDFSFVSLSPDGSALYTSGRTFAVGRGQDPPPAATRPDEGSLLRTSPDGTVLAASSALGNSVRLIDPRTGRSLRELTGHTEAPLALAFSPDGRSLATLSEDRTVYVWDVTTGLAREHLDLSESAKAVAFSPDGHTLYTAGPDRAIRAWDLDGSRRLVEQVRPPSGFRYGIHFPAPGGDFVAITFREGLYIRDVVAGTRTATLDRGGGWAFNGGAWSPDARRFATVAGGVVKIWDPHTGDLLRSADPPEVGGRVSSLSYTPDGSRIVLGEQSGRVTMLDADGLTPVGQPVVLDTPVCCLAAGSDNTTAVVLTGGPTASGELYRPSGGWALVDLVTGRVVRSGSLGIPDGVWVAASPRGRYAAVVGGKGEVVVIDTAKGALVRPPVTAHDDVGNVIFYSADGTRVVSSGWDGSISLVDGRTGELLGTTVVPERVIASAGFMHDDTTVLVASYRQSIYRWDTRPERALEFACDIAGRNLTHAEWRDNFTQRPYEKTCP
jgi:WD40 repeat protein